MYKILLLIFLGGGLGSIFRYLSQVLVNKWISIHFPLGTLAVNIVGSFLIGIALALLGNNQHHVMRFLFVIGFCGGFTTFSTFSYDSVVLLKEADYLLFGLNVLGNVVLCILSTIAGLLLAKNLFL